MRQGFHTFRANADTGLSRKETWEGRDYLVVPVIALVQGVIQASNAAQPELALADEFARAPAGWNGRPLVMNHPKDVDGNPVSANSPEVLSAYQFGYVFGSQRKDNAKNVPCLACEAWIDIERAKTLNDNTKRVLERVEAGEMVEISTGLYSVSQPQMGVYESKRYDAVWRDVVPDHLAILDETLTGACSIENGCGLMRTNDANDQTKPAIEKPAPSIPAGVLLPSDAIISTPAQESAYDEVDGVEGAGNVVPQPGARQNTKTQQPESYQRKPKTMGYKMKSNCGCKEGKEPAEGTSEEPVVNETTEITVEKTDPAALLDTPDHTIGAWYFNQLFPSENKEVSPKINSAWMKTLSGKPPVLASEVKPTSKTQARMLGGIKALQQSKLLVHDYPSGMAARDVAALLCVALEHVFMGYSYVITFTKDVCVFGYYDPDSYEYDNYQVPYTVDDGGKVTFTGPATEVVLLTKIVQVQDTAVSGGNSVLSLNNEHEDPMSKVDPKPGEGGTPEIKDNAAPVAPVAPAPKALSAAEYIDQAPPEVREALKDGMRALEAKKNGFITQIKANTRNTFTDEQLKGMDISMLEGLAGLAVTPSFAGQGGSSHGAGGDLRANEQPDDQKAPPAPLLVFERPGDKKPAAAA